MSKENNLRIAKNTMTLYLRMIVTMLVSLYTSRIVLDILGVIDYGIYNVVGGVVLMLSFFNNALSSSTQRFLSFEIGRSDIGTLKKTFNASLLVHLSLSIVIFILAETIGIWALKSYLSIPENRLESAIIVYHFSVITFVTSVVQVPFSAIIIAFERIKIYAYISVFESVLKLILVLLLSAISYDKLITYGFFIFVVNLLITILFAIYAKVNLPETKIELINDKALIKEFLNFSSWSLFGSFSVVTTNQGIPLVFNYFLGVVINASIGIANQVNSALFSFVSSFQTAFKPQIVKLFANKEYFELKRLIFISTKFSFLIISLIIIPIFFEVDYILKVWLVNVPAYTAKFTQILLLTSLIEALSGPYWIAANAIGNIKKYQIIVSFLFVLNFPLTYILLENSFSPIHAFYIRLLISFIIYAYRISYVKNRLEFTSRQVWIFNFSLLFFFAFLLSITYILKICFFQNINSLFSLFQFVSISSLISLFVIWFFYLKHSEKEFVKLIIFK